MSVERSGVWYGSVVVAACAVLVLSLVFSCGQPRVLDALYCQCGVAYAGAAGVSNETSAETATVFLDEDFDKENGGEGALRYSRFENWEIIEGTVDLIGSGFWDFFPEHGLYLDLDGSTMTAGTMQSAQPLSLEPGAYRFSFELAGSPLGGRNTVVVSVGSVYTETFTLDSSEPFVLIERRLVVIQPTSARIRFAHRGGDNKGLLLDNVRLVQEPTEDARKDEQREAAAPSSAGAEFKFSDIWAQRWTVTGSIETAPGGYQAGFHEEPAILGAAHPSTARSGILYVHPESQDKPVRISRRVVVPEINPRLLIGACGNHDIAGDWSLLVVVNDQSIEKPRIIAGRDGWVDLAYSLEEFEGEEVTIEVQVWANNWYYEYAFIDYLIVAGDTDSAVAAGMSSVQQSVFRLTTGQLVLADLVAFNNGVFLVQRGDDVVELARDTVQAVLMGDVASLQAGDSEAASRISQWASDAYASSEYSQERWCALQATGEPDTLECGDFDTAWAPRESNSEPEWIELYFEEPVYAEQLRVHETYSTGFITKVELIDVGGTPHVLWEGSDSTQCPGWFELRFGPTPYLVESVMLYTAVKGFEEVDAVMLTGLRP